MAGMAAMMAAPVATEAQQPTKVAQVGILAQAVPVVIPRALRQRLNELGWAEGRNLVFEQRVGHPSRLPILASELVRLNVDVIVAVGNPAIRAAKETTATIPIVMAFSGGDPVRAGFVASLARPGGNVTGLTVLSPDLTVKRFEVLRAALPGASRIAFLVNPRSPGTFEQLAAIRAAASAVSVAIKAVEVGHPDKYAEAFTGIAQDRPHAIVVPSEPEFFRDRRILVDLVAKTGLPAAYDWREFVEIGGLMSYGPSLEDLTARLAVYVDKILRGAQPGHLPVEQPTKFELVINMKTAKALNLTIPPSLLLRADQVIE
jgi:putative ABC transport system substrate-binding protein